MKKVLMTASESSHFRNFHIPYIMYLQSRGAEVFTAANGDLELEGVVHTRLGFRKKLTSPANIAVIFKLARLICRERFDAVYTNSTLAGFAGRMALILSGSRKTRCCHICHGYLFDDDGSARAKVYTAFEKLVRRRTDLLAVMNADDLAIAQKNSLGREIVFLDGMGLNAEKFPPLPAEQTEELRKALGAREDEILFVCVGEFSPRKNQAMILRAFAGCERPARLIFAGDGELLGDCRALAKALGIDGRTVFLGHYNNVNLLYRACDCLISASRYEGLPFNVMEALYCGESVLLSDVKGNRDLAEGAGLYPYNDEARLTELMNSAEKVPGGGLPLRYLLENAFTENIRKLRYDK